MRAAQHIKTVLLIALAFIFTQADGQTYYFFQDSPSTEFYDFSWMELTSPSELERKSGDLRKFPVEASIPAQQGLNSLRLKWKSMTGGEWYAIAAASGWTNYDISNSDTLQFYLRSETGILASDLPKVFVEDILI